jgi:hypothetical protein
VKPLVLLCAILLAANGIAQVRPVYSSIESNAAGAKVICVGKIAKIEDVSIDSYAAIELTIQVSETLKGDPQKTIKAHRFGSFGYDTKQYYESAQKAGTEFVSENELPALLLESFCTGIFYARGLSDCSPSREAT